jgi:phosphoglycolate phosphatase
MSPDRLAELVASVRVVVFDLDDTLIATYRTSYLRTCAAVAALGLPPLDEESFRNIYGRHPFPECARRWYPTLDLQDFIAAYAGSAAAASYTPLCDLDRLFAGLERLGFAAAILTNCTRAQATRKFVQVCLKSPALPFLVLCAEDLDAPKPSPRAFDALLRATHLPSEDHIYFGDAKSDEVAARGAGLRFVGVGTGPHPVGPPNMSVARLLDIIEGSLPPTARPAQELD